jgi:dTDP-4-dehydrorhamnose reductase
MRNILVTGGAGQVGLELQRVAWPQDVVLHCPDRDELDIGDMQSVEALFRRMSFSAVINSAAYTAVDKAEADSAAAFCANAQGPANLAQATRLAAIPLLQVSTDYVFDGSKDTPYAETDPVAPLGVYGASKLAGEYAALSGNPRSVILRTAWVLSAHRNNFLKTMLRVAANQAELRVVDDQIGCPTSAQDIAIALQIIAIRLIEDAQAPVGIYHFVNQGEASWCELARTIFALSASAGGASAQVAAITTAEYPTPAKRPANSRLSTAKIQLDYAIAPRDWREAVKDIIQELAEPTSYSAGSINA